MRRIKLSSKNAKRLLAGMLLLAMIVSTCVYGGIIPKKTVRAGEAATDTVTVYDFFDQKGLVDKSYYGAGQATYDWAQDNIGTMRDTVQTNEAVKMHIQFDEGWPINQNLYFSAYDPGTRVNATYGGYIFELKHNDNLKMYVNIYAGSSNLSAGGVLLCSWKEIPGVPEEFDFEYGVTLIKDGDEIIGRRPYAKIDGKEVSFAIDNKADYEARKKDDTTPFVLGANNSMMIHPELKVTLSSLQTIHVAEPTIYDLMDLSGKQSLSIDATSGAKVGHIGFLNDTVNTNEAIQFHVDTNGGLQNALLFGIYKGQGVNVRDFPNVDAGRKSSGYLIKLHTNGLLQLYSPDDNHYSKLLSQVNILAGLQWSAIPSEWDMEYGVVQVLNEEDKVVGRKVYVKMDDKEVLSYMDPMKSIQDRVIYDAEYIMGEYTPVLVEQGSNITLESHLSYTHATPTIRDFYDDLRTRTFELDATKEAKGQLLATFKDTANQNEAFKFHMDFNGGLKSDMTIGLYKDEPVTHDSKNPISGYQLLFHPHDAAGKSVGLYLRCGNETILTSTTFDNGALPNDFDFEFGVVQVKDQADTLVSRYIYVKVDDKEVLSYYDTIEAYNGRLYSPQGYVYGPNLVISAVKGNRITLKSLNLDSEGVPEKLQNPEKIDFEDFGINTGRRTVVIKEGTQDKISRVSSINAGFTFRVERPKTGKVEFGFYTDSGWNYNGGYVLRMTSLDNGDAASFTLLGRVGNTIVEHDQTDKLTGFKDKYVTISVILTDAEAKDYKHTVHVLINGQELLTYKTNTRISIGRHMGCASVGAGDVVLTTSEDANYSIPKNIVFEDMRQTTKRAFMVASLYVPVDLGQVTEVTKGFTYKVTVPSAGRGQLGFYNLQKKNPQFFGYELHCDNIGDEIKMRLYSTSTSIGEMAVGYIKKKPGDMMTISAWVTDVSTKHNKHTFHLAIDGEEIFRYANVTEKVELGKYMTINSGWTEEIIELKTADPKYVEYDPTAPNGPGATSSGDQTLTDDAITSEDTDKIENDKEGKTDNDKKGSGTIFVNNTVKYVLIGVAALVVVGAITTASVLLIKRKSGKNKQES